jgi:hypothetical protein
VFPSRSALNAQVLSRAFRCSCRETAGISGLNIRWSWYKLLIVLVFIFNVASMLRRAGVAGKHMGSSGSWERLRRHALDLLAPIRPDDVAFEYHFDAQSTVRFRRSERCRQSWGRQRHRICPRLDRRPEFRPARVRSLERAFAERPSNASTAGIQNRVRSGSNDLHPLRPCYCKSMG